MVRRRTPQKGFSALPPISKILAPPEPPRAPEPVEEPVEEEELAPQPVEAAAVEPAEEAIGPDDEKVIHIKPPVIVKELAVHLNLKPFQLISDLMEMNIFAAINHTLDPEIVSTICKKYGFTFEKERRERGAGVHKVEVAVEPPKPPPPPKKDELKPRAPIVTFMGHVDHGKTSLMDTIRKARVASGEAGGITQHIGAYTIEYNGQGITFLDTPGHAAFSAMRARGANITDMVVLVVAANDGVMPQTIEALNHAKAAKVPIVVAINKIDLPAANIDRVKGQLQEQGLTPEDWGGETIVCPVSAINGTGVDHLLDMLLLQAEILELKASPTVPPRGRVVEARLEAGRGPTATVLVRAGTLKIGQPFICGNYFGKVKNLINDKGQRVNEAGPSVPVQVLGFSGLPNAGDQLLVMESEKAAKLLSDERLAAERTGKLTVPKGRATLESLFANIAADAKKVLRIIVKADAQGALEALLASLRDIASKKVSLDIIHSAVGPVTESDAVLAAASNAVVVGFGVKVENSAAAVARRETVQIKLYSIIYELIDQIKESMAGLLDPEVRETVIGHAEVKQVFQLTRGVVAGCAVTDGRISRAARARVLRRRQAVYDGNIATLRRFQDDVKEVRNGLECGIKLGDYNEYEPGDIIECYQLEKYKQLL
ncbi:MAG TPA: translation initiation factor IF-2 [Chthoniobacteraceae bacterium]|nr:translation initiation factor IF-2 [Chthoniobacteraceae bacterium]